MGKTKFWSKTVFHEGLRLRIYERANSASLWVATAVDGEQRRTSLKTADKKVAVESAKAVAEEMRRQQFSPKRSGPLPFTTLRALFIQHEGPLLSPSRLRYVKTVLNLWERHLEGVRHDFIVQDISRTHVKAYLQARVAGRLRPKNYRASASPAPNTLRNEVSILGQVCRWGTDYKVDEEPLLSSNPVRMKWAPDAERRRLPVMEPERYEKLLAVAPDVDPMLRPLMVLAWGTGRRINAILNLRASDYLRTPEQMEAAGIAAGDAKQWRAAIRWRAEHDKVGRESVAPINESVQAELDRWLSERPVLGEGFLFPDHRDGAGATNKARAYYLLVEAEKAAGLAKRDRGGWHSFRRAWANARKHLPPQDVAATGGWFDLHALQAVYQRDDASTMQAVADAS